MRKHNVLFGAVLMAICLLFAFSNMTVHAAEFDSKKLSTLSVNFKPGASSTGTEFRIYRAADISDTDGFTLSGDFAGCNVVLNKLDTEGWEKAAETVYQYVKERKISYTASAHTDSLGTAGFDGLTSGLYLVEGDACIVNEHTYTPTPFLVSLPGRQQNDEWTYSVTADAKYTDNYNPPEETKGTLKVIKSWEGDTDADRPGRITVELFHEKTHNRTVTLSRAGNWTYTDEQISTSLLDGDWSVEEVKVDGYVMKDADVSVEGRTVTITITNTKDIPDTPGPSGTPGPSDTPGPSGNPETPGTPGPSGTPGSTYSLNRPDNPNSSGQTDGQEYSKKSSSGAKLKLPQTGMLWWPVPVLYLAGIVMVAAGLYIRREKREKDRKA